MKTKVVQNSLQLVLSRQSFFILHWLNYHCSTTTNGVSTESLEVVRVEMREALSYLRKQLSVS